MLDTTDDILHLWDQFKSSVKTIAIMKGKQLSKYRRNREKHLQRELEQLKLTDNDTEIHRVQTELEEIRLHKCRGAQIRTRFKQIDAEQPTAQFLAMEQNIQKSRMIPQIIDMQGTHTNIEERGGTHIHLEEGEGHTQT